MPKKHKIKITPSIDIKIRHQIEAVLKNSGKFEIIGAGTDLVEDSMDISFVEKED